MTEIAENKSKVGTGETSSHRTRKEGSIVNKKKTIGGQALTCIAL